MILSPVDMNAETGEQTSADKRDSDMKFIVDDRDLLEGECSLYFHQKWCEVLCTYFVWCALLRNVY